MFLIFKYEFGLSWFDLLAEWLALLRISKIVLKWKNGRTEERKNEMQLSYILDCSNHLHEKVRKVLRGL
jgi:hypothetical protein